MKTEGSGSRHLTYQEKQDIFRQAIADGSVGLLRGRELCVLSARLEGKSLEEIGKMLRSCRQGAGLGAMTRERARQIEGRALEVLQNPSLRDRQNPEGFTRKYVDKLGEDPIGFLQNLADQGHWVASMARELGIPPKTMEDLVKRGGVKKRELLKQIKVAEPPSCISKKYRSILGNNPGRQLQDWVDAGYTYETIQCLTGASCYTVRRWLDKFNIACSKRPRKWDFSPIPGILPAGYDQHIQRPEGQEHFSEFDLLGLSAGTRNAIGRAGISHLYEVDGRSDRELLFFIRRFGPKRLQELRSKMQEFRNKVIMEQQAGNGNRRQF